ncbi:uncharacterized protein LOC111021343 [Momordica charantia]|uniref:Uncharacterized protein LOC111021343 n=1 Tax=Momordica charantia TaxID=3673 RepID=A0A6J1DM94_MOMCH|nr:uncharacterized protein LOC111021343 [Momordica charantia]
MSTFLISRIAADKLTVDKYPTSKTNLSAILVVDDLYFVLTEAYLKAPESDATKFVCGAYDRWTKANSKARFYVLASISDVLANKHEIMITALQIMYSFGDMFGKPS